jgi:hypothetical protein
MGSDDFGRLLEGEEILWKGQPGTGILLTPRDGFLIPFSLLWGGFAVFWETSVLRQRDAPAFFALFGIPFVLIGLYLIFGRFLFDALIRRNMRYAVTNRRVLIKRSGIFSKFTAIDLERLPSADLLEGSNGRGTIRFGQSAPVWLQGNMSGWTPSLDSTPQFLDIDNVRAVFDRIQRLVTRRP